MAVSDGSPFCNSPSRLGLIVGDCKAHLLSRWKEKVSTSNGYRSSMAIRRPLHEKVNCRTEPRNSACSTDCRSGMRTAGEGGLAPVFASRESMPNRLFPSARHNCSREAEDGMGQNCKSCRTELDSWSRIPAHRARKSIFHPPLRSRSVGSIGLCGRSYCRRPSSGSGREADCKSSLSEAELRQQGPDCKSCRTGDENKLVRKNTFQHDRQCMR